MEDKIVFGNDGLVIEVVSLFEVPHIPEEVVGDTGANNYSLGFIEKAKVLKFTTKNDLCFDGHLQDSFNRNNVIFYLFKPVKITFDNFIVNVEKT